MRILCINCEAENDDRLGVGESACGAGCFFPSAEAALLANIAQLAAKYHIASVTPFAPDGSPYAEVEKIATDSIMELAQIYERLPDLLEESSVLRN